MLAPTPRDPAKDLSGEALPNEERAPRRHSPRRTAQGIDWWVHLVPLLGIAQLSLFVILKSRPGPLGIALWYVAPWGLGFLAIGVLVLGVAWSALRRPFWTGWRGSGFLGLAAVILVSGTYRVYPSSYDHSPSQIGFRLPLEGPITVAWGGSTREANYHVVAPDQRWAYDLLVTHNGRSFRGAGTELEHYHAFGLPVLAPADGRVQAAADGEPDQPVGAKWKGKLVVGNHVVLEVGPQQFLFVAHLQSGSVAVQAGDRVRAGQVLGRVGNSGKSSEPHVHVHLQDTPVLHFGEGIPLYFHAYRLGDSLVQRGMPTGGITENRMTGQIVENVAP